MRTIYKYPVSVDDEFTVEMHRDAEILCVQTQRGVPQMWAVVYTERPLETRTFRLVGTGHPFDRPIGKAELYRGTFKVMDDALVFHLFEIYQDFNH